MKFLLLQDNPIADASSGIADATSEIGKYLGLSGPFLSILGGLAILIIGYFVAKLIGRLFRKFLHKLGVDKGSTSQTPLSHFGGKLVYYLLMIIVLMATLSVVGVSGDVLSPLSEMTSKFLSAIPNIVVAVLIAYIGYLLAKIVSGLVETSGDKIREFLPKLKLEDANFDIVKVLKNIVFIFIFIPILIIALEKLNIDVITIPATNMLNKFLAAVPAIIYATIILLIAVFGGKILKSIVADLLASLKVNDLSHKLKLQHVIGQINLANIIANIVFVFIIYIGIIEACKILALQEIAEILDTVLAVIGKIVFGLIILALGNIVADFAAKIFNTSQFIKSLIKGVILMIFIAMGLSAMGIANNIIELAFGLGLGAIAVAFALAFGLGGKEAAGEEVKEFFNKIKKKE